MFVWKVGQGVVRAHTHRYNPGMTHHTRLDPDYEPGATAAGGSASTIRSSWGSPSQPVGDLALGAQVGLDALTQLLKAPDASELVACAAAKHTAALLEVASCLVAEDGFVNASSTVRSVVRATRISAAATMDLHVVLGSIFGELATFSGPSAMSTVLTTIMRSTLEQVYPTSPKLLQRTPVQAALDADAPQGESADALGVGEHYGLWLAMTREDPSSAQALAGYARRATLLLLILNLCQHGLVAPSDLVAISEACAAHTKNSERMGAVWRLAGINPKEQGATT
jgi:hypothetical protein